MAPRDSSRWFSALAVLSLALSACGGCGGGGTVTAEGEVVLRPETLDFGLRSVGAQAEQGAEVENLGRATVGVTWELEPGPFAVEALPGTLAPGAHALRVRYAPTVPGTFERTLVVRVGGEEAGRLVLRAQAREVPTCVAPGVCRTARFDVQAEQCVESLEADGTTCETDNLCLLDAVCRQGECLGRARVCDDQNACTVDVCRPLIGCEFLPGPPCAAEGPCSRGFCDPEIGCTEEPVDDGTPCVGGRTTCEVMDVCFGGLCREEPTPNPSTVVCAEATPCQGEGRCQGTTCVQPPPVVLGPDWTLDARGDPGNPATERGLHDLWMDEDGAVSLEGWPFGLPIFRASEPTGGVTGFTTSRRCLGWDGRPVCSDYPLDAAVSLILADSGDPLWTFQLTATTPGVEGYFSAVPGLTFVTRLATLASDRLLAIYEGYHPEATSGTDNRRRYAAVVLDAQGRLVRATRLQDPLLERTDHPHPFGVAADALGNVYLSFSPSMARQGQDGVIAGSPTLLLSISREGQERWRLQHDVQGGELAVAEGVLYPERSVRAFSALDGSVVAPLDHHNPTVVGGGHAIVADDQGGLVARRSPTLEPGWTSPLPPGMGGASPILTLARWQPRPAVDRTVVLQQLVPSNAVGGSSLLGVDAQTGQRAFLCPLLQPSGQPLAPAQRFHSAGGFLALMDLARPAGDDPPFASSSARFTRYPLPTLATPQAPWAGRFGGYDHDHQEDVAPLPPLP